MIKEYIGIGKTVEEATLAAKAGLNAPLTADVKIEVVEMPKKKILGLFGGSDAKIKASYDDGKKEKKPTNKQPRKDYKKSEPKKQSQSAPKAEKKPAPVKKESNRAPKADVNTTAYQPRERERDYPESVDLEYAKQYLAQIIKGLNIDNANITASYEQGVITMDLECDDYGIIIGRRGDTLDSIQYLLSLIMKKNAGGYVRVVLNVGNYREKRQETLKNLARKNAEYVMRSGRRYTFEPMNPYERRIIHTTIQEIDGVVSTSVGYNQDRRVVIEPVGGVRPRYNNGGYRRSSSRPTKSAPSADYKPKADRADLPKFGKIEVNKD